VTTSPPVGICPVAERSTARLGSKGLSPRLGVSLPWKNFKQSPCDSKILNFLICEMADSNAYFKEEVEGRKERV
jgi:hypothetical protein